MPLKIPMYFVVVNAHLKVESCLAPDFSVVAGGDAEIFPD